MLDLNTTLSSPNDMLHQRLNPLHSFLTLNAESCFSSPISHVGRDAVACALPLRGTSHEISLAPKIMDMISTEHSASSVLTSKTPSDLGLLVDCEASSKHVNQCNDRSICEHDYLNRSDRKRKSGVDYGDYRLVTDNQRPYHEHHSHKLHEVSDPRPSADDCKLSLEGESSSVVDGKALPLESTGSVISTNGMIEETHNLRDFLYPHNMSEVPNSRNIAEAMYGVCKSSMTSVGAAVHAYDSSVEEDAEGGGCILTTRELFPLKPCSETSNEGGAISSVLHHANTIKPIIKANSECVGGALTSVTSNILNSNPEPVSASNFPNIRPGPWSFPSSPHIPLPSSMGILNPITSGIQPMKKSRRGPRSRSSQYRGVTFYRRTGRWESHIWDCGKQVYLGGFDTAHAAARAYDRAAIRFRGLGADINFNLGDYESEINQMNSVSKEEFVHLLRRQSMGFARGSSRFRGVTLHKCGRWEARMGQFLGKKAYDEAAIQSNGREALTNFDTRFYDKDLVKKPSSDAYEDNLELSLGMPLGRQRGLHTEEARNPIAKHPPYSDGSPTLPGSPMTGSLWLKNDGAFINKGQVGTGNQSFSGPYNCPSQLYKHSLLDNNSLPQMDNRIPTQDKTASDGNSHTYTGQLISANKASLFTEASSSYKLFTSAMDHSSTQQQSSPITCLEPPPLPPPPLAAGGWHWQMQQNVCPATVLSSSAFTVPGHTAPPMQAAAASSGFSPQQGFTFPQWLNKTGLSYMSTASIHPSH